MWLDIVLRRLLLGLVGLVGLRVLVLRFEVVFRRDVSGLFGVVGVVLCLGLVVVGVGWL